MSRFINNTKFVNFEQSNRPTEKMKRILLEYRLLLEKIEICTDFLAIQKVQSDSATVVAALGTPVHPRMLILWSGLAQNHRKSMQLKRQHL